ncbi:hypothetical protein [Rhodoferax sp.]|nr:hypothetical protein [Rhodoferax sp.]
MSGDSAAHEEDASSATVKTDGMGFKWMCATLVKYQAPVRLAS